MEATAANTVLRESALRSIGRNVVNFQKLERCLKFLALLRRIEGPISKITLEQEKRVETISRHTLGQAIQEWHKIVSEEKSSVGTVADLFEPWVSTSFDIGMDKEKAADYIRAFSDLAIERNNLIHHDLATIDFESAAQCQEIIRKLDDQNVRILEQLNALAPLIAEIRSLASAHQSFLESDEFMNHLNTMATQTDA